jgi:hypothetical protein
VSFFHLSSRVQACLFATYTHRWLVGAVQSDIQEIGKCIASSVPMSFPSEGCSSCAAKPIRQVANSILYKENHQMTTNPPKRQAQQPEKSVRRWLLDSDPSIRWQVMHDLIGAPAGKSRPNPPGSQRRVGVPGCSRPITPARCRSTWESAKAGRAGGLHSTP